MANISEFLDIFLIGFAVNALLKDPGWHLRGDEAGIILAMSGLGTVLGAIIAGRLADAIGRKQTSFWYILLSSTFTIASVFTPTGAWGILAALRVLVGIGVGGMNIVSIPYVQEFVPAKRRGLLAGLTAVFIPLGLFLGSAASWVTGSNWRLLTALGGLPVFLLVWLAFVPESPRFLQSKGRLDEARKALAWALQVPVGQIGELPMVRDSVPASLSLVFSRHSRSLVIISLGSFCFIFGSPVIRPGPVDPRLRLQVQQPDGGQPVHAGGVGGPARAPVLGMAGRQDRPQEADVQLRPARRARASDLGRVDDVFGRERRRRLDLLRRHPDRHDVRRRRVRRAESVLGAAQCPNEARATGLGLGYGIGASAEVFRPALLGVVFGARVSADIIPPAFLLVAVLLFVGGIVYLFARETNGIRGLPRLAVLAAGT